MKHCDEATLVLHYYGEDGRRRRAVGRHLEDCPACAAEYRALAATLGGIPDPISPERGDRYGLEVWLKISHRLPEPEAPRWPDWLAWRPMAVGAAAVLVLVSTFVAGRLSRREPPTAAPAALAQPTGAARVRVMHAAISDHLERSERVLLDLANATGTEVNISDEQAWAEDLIDSNRLYREAAVQAGDRATADVLDELERSLLDVVHGPSTLTPADLDRLRVRLDAATLLFKIRVLHDELRGRQAPASPRKTT
ncbi:MAG: hypothetical protein ACM3SQ_03890 [Betaproteobacteria bacterium]